MSAFLSKVGQWFVKTFGPLLVRYIKDHFTAWQERQRLRKEQEAKDEATKQQYDQAVQSGTKEEVRRATEDRLNS